MIYLFILKFGNFGMRVRSIKDYKIVLFVIILNFSMPLTSKLSTLISTFPKIKAIFKFNMMRERDEWREKEEEEDRFNLQNFLCPTTTIPLLKF